MRGLKTELFKISPQINLGTFLCNQRILFIILYLSLDKQTKICYSMLVHEKYHITDLKHDMCLLYMCFKFILLSLQRFLIFFGKRFLFYLLRRFLHGRVRIQSYDICYCIRII